MTDGMLLREALRSPSLERYQVHFQDQACCCWACVSVNNDYPTIAHGNHNAGSDSG